MGLINKNGKDQKLVWTLELGLRHVSSCADVLQSKRPHQCGSGPKLIFCSLRAHLG